MRVAILADMLEEQWPSMDLVAEALVRELPTQDVWAVEPWLVRPALIPVVGRLDGRHDTPTADRVFNRFWLYRRALRAARRAGCSVFHVVDHSYAHLTLQLPAGRTVVTCHDADAFRSLHAPEFREGGLPQFLVKRLARGLRYARVVACPTRATADEVIAAGLVDKNRITVVPNGVDASPPDAEADAEAARLLAGPLASIDVLHVGSTIARKRIDVLLTTVARLAARRPGVRLVRIGGPFTPAQHAHASRLGLLDRITVLPFLPRPVLSAVYRRATLSLLTSDREGFGLPLVESLAAGVPVVARDLPVFREVGAECATYVAGDDGDAWAAACERLLTERDRHPAGWRARQQAGRRRAETFSWSRYAESMAALYRRVASETRPAETR